MSFVLTVSMNPSASRPGRIMVSFQILFVSLEIYLQTKYLTESAGSRSTLHSNRKQDDLGKGIYQRLR